MGTKRLYQEFGRYWIDISKAIAITGIVYPVLKKNFDWLLIAGACVFGSIFLALGLYFVYKGGKE